jgi:hypothetical protein
LTGNKQKKSNLLNIIGFMDRKQLPEFLDIYGDMMAYSRDIQTEPVIIGDELSNICLYTFPIDAHYCVRLPGSAEIPVRTAPSTGL